MEKEKILVIGMTGILGGVETFIRNIYSEFDYERYSVDFLHHSPEGILFEDEFRKNGSQIYYCKKFMQNPVESYRQIKAIYEAGKYDVVHCNTCTSTVIVYFLPSVFMKKRPKIVMHSHSANSERKFKVIPHLLIRPVLNILVDNRLACSDKAGLWMYGEKHTYRIIKNGVKIKDFLYDENIRMTMRNKYGYTADDIVIGSVGRLETVKNHRFLIDVMAHLDSRYKYMIIGDGELKEELLKQIDTLGLVDRVKILPSTSKVNEYYQMFDIYSQPSLFEGLPMTCVEAQSAGLPVLLSDGISQDARLSDDVQFISLKDMDGWINAIKAIHLGRRINKLEDIGQLDCKNSARQLMDIFSC